tara:strand:+ start:863 stop:3505 length:2643 start_codon:yes stop_codon:yes gene_type:complete
MKKKVVLFLIFFISINSTFPFSKKLINSVPLASDQNVSVTEQTSYIINLVASDADGDALTYSIVDTPSNGTAVLSGRTVTYTSNSDTAISDSFTFKVNDGISDSSKATVTITITPINDSPIANSQTNVNADENIEKSITLTGSDLEGDNLSFILVTAPKYGRLLDPGNGNKTIFNGTLSSNLVTYLSTSDNATSDSFVFKSFDGNSVSENASVSISINQVNDPPIAIGEDIVLTEEVPTNIILSATDPDGTIPAVFKITSLTNGNLTDPGNGNSVITAGTTLNGNTVTFTSNNLANSDSFTFVANDGFLDSKESTITINIITDAPTASPQNVTVIEQVDKKITLLGTDKEGDNLTYIISSLPTIGTLKEGGVIITQDQLPKTTANTDLVYNSNSDVALTDSFKFKVNDGISNSSAASVSITIDPVNDKPVAIAQLNVAATEQTLLAITLNGTDPDGDLLTYAIVDVPANGTVSLVGSKLSYTSNSNTAVSDSFTFKVNDGKLDSDKATVSIVIAPINDSPIPVSQNLTTIEDIKLEITLTASDPDDTILTYLIEGAPVNGTTTIIDNKVTYTPDLGYYGNDAFIFRANDGQTSGTAGFVEISITSNDFDNDGILNDFDICPNTPLGSKVDVEGCVVFELPMNNNKVEVINTSCIGTTDGSIEISIEDNTYDYNVTITDPSDKVSFYLIDGTDKKGSFKNLSKGTYDVCFKVSGQTNYEQCFSVFVGNPSPLSAFVDVNNDDKITSIELSGSSSYNIKINGESHNITTDKFVTKLKTGLNIIKISTDLPCQGIIEKEIFISEDILYYPNPTNGEVDMYVAGKDEVVILSVYNIKGELIYTKNQKILQSRKSELNLSGVPSGTYIINLESPTVRKTFKIIKN